MAGVDPRDSTSADIPVPSYREQFVSRATMEKPLNGMTVGVPREYFPDSLDEGIRNLCDRAIDSLKALGATVREVSLPHTSLAIPVYYIIAPAEASSNLARFDGVRYGQRITSGDGLRSMYEATRSAGPSTAARQCSLCAADTSCWAADIEAATALCWPAPDS